MRDLNFSKAQALLIAVFVMLGLSLVVWTVVNMATSDLATASRAFDSERALYIAEAGAGWALDKADGNYSGFCDGLPYGMPHNFGSGQYYVQCDSNNSNIISTGYLPSKDICDNSTVLCRGKRTVVRSLGSSFSRHLIMAKNTFDWASSLSSPYASKSYFDGDISAADYNSNSNVPYSTGLSYTRDTESFSFSLANVNMSGYYANATHVWPSTAASCIKGYADADRNLRYSFDAFKLGDMWGRDIAWAQSFRPPTTSSAANRRVDKIRFLFGPNHGNPNGNIAIKVYQDTLPGTLLGNYVIAANAIVPSDWNEITLSPYMTLPQYGTGPGRSQVCYLTVENANANQTCEDRYTLRMTNYDNGSTYYKQTSPSAGSWTQSTYGGTSTNSDLAFELLYGSTTRVASDKNYIYVSAAPFVVGNAGGNEYDAAQSFMIKPWATSAVVSSIGTLHAASTGSPSGAIGVHLEYDAGGQTINDEAQYSISTTQVKASSTGITSVIGVWDKLAHAASDTNYYTGGSFNSDTGVITLGTSLSSSPVQLYITYTYVYPDGMPSGTLVPGTNTSYTAGSGWRTASFSSPVTLTENQRYWIVWDAAAQSNNSYYNMAGGGYKYGLSTYRINSGAWTTPRDPDVFFKINLQDGSSITADSSTGFFAGMVGEALKNFDAGDVWSDDEFAIITTVDNVTYNDGYISGGGTIANARAELDRDIDWSDTDDVELVHRFTTTGGINSAVQNWYIAGSAMFDLGTGSIVHQNKSFIAEGSIGITPSGSTNTISLQANAVSPQPLLFAAEGDIYSSAPSTSGSALTQTQRRIFNGTICSVDGNVDFNHICAADGCLAGSGTLIMGKNVSIAGYAYMDNNSNSIVDLIDADTSVGFWGEE